ncbi:response regulator [Paenibacillus sp. Marseille-Q4541]|uniref:response regulator n=1 Tax=Paenibacillus sp. Marseille-Q4541 TaxID=2831522 RepID=UPI001BA7F219|nr:response regulator [Paenibacillus sp. Marseille-Q4541]
MMDVLLVDDETYVTESLEATIPWSELGIRNVYRSDSAGEALQQLAAHPIDILITDIRMPGMSGLELIEKASVMYPDLRSILLTGYGEFEYAKKAVQLGAIDYIIKPVDDEDFIKSVKQAVQSIEEQGKQANKYQQLLYQRKSDYTLLRENLLQQLLIGEQIPLMRTEQLLHDYEIPLTVSTLTITILVQLNKGFMEHDGKTRVLMEYAIGNMAEEIFGDTYQIWQSRTPHHCLIMMLQPKDNNIGACMGSECLEPKHLRPLIQKFRSSVLSYLRGEVHVIVNPPCFFPEDISEIYRRALNSVYLADRQMEAGVVFLQKDQTATESPSSKAAFEVLYRPPMLQQLLERKGWEAASLRLNEMFAVIEKHPVSREHMYEIYLAIINSFLYVTHQTGHRISELDARGLEPHVVERMIHYPALLKQYTEQILMKLEQELSVPSPPKSHIVSQVKDMISTEEGSELTVKTIADRVFLHPVYLSKIFKAETGEGLSEYIIRIRLERALYLLKHTNKKIYEITTELGYQNPQYFSKLFKKHYGITPNEYRDQ